MDIWMIWAEEPWNETHWLVEAWDDDSVSSNHEGWTEAVKKAREAYGADNIRILKSRIDFEAVCAAFLPSSLPPMGTVYPQDEISGEAQ